MDVEVISSSGGPVLQLWLVETGRKAAWVAAQLGVDASLVSHWIGGRRLPSAEQAAALETLSGGAVKAVTW